MNLEIEKDTRSNNCIKMPYGTSSKEARRIAILDITTECGNGKFYTKNYIQTEGQVLENCKKVLIVLPIDTTIY